MGFQTGLSGLSVSSKDLDVIGNNVANASVVGFKGSGTQFADVYAGSLASSGSGQVGIGAKVATVAQSFSQGNITPTSNSLDFAIGGRGFFRLSDNGEIVYSRNGQFRLDDQGYIVNSDGLNLTGYGVDSTGAIVNSTPQNLRFDTSDIPPQATSSFEIGVNLTAKTTEPVPSAAFDPTNVSSYNYSTSGTVFDSLGSSHTMTYYFVKTATANQWDMYATVDRGAAADVDLGGGAGVATTLNFDPATGALTTSMPL
ncbi:MAG: flagellar hook-basal body complex protein, partial [Betaproteobacteria bacterium]|nr:flagellar hook-basal body complex protein [Betaproteobacteria bacterium]